MECDFIRRVAFYYQHKEFIDKCMSYMKYVRGLDESDAERICYELAAQ